jgi:hypothetical protein
MSVQHLDQRYADGPLCPACSSVHPMLAACASRPAFLSTWRPRSESAPGPLERRDDNTGN